MQGWLSHGISFGLQPKDRRRLCEILVFRSSWPFVGRVVWDGLSVNVARISKLAVGCVAGGSEAGRDVTTVKT